MEWGRGDYGNKKLVWRKFAQDFLRNISSFFKDFFPMRSTAIRNKRFFKRNYFLFFRFLPEGFPHEFLLHELYAISTPLFPHLPTYIILLMDSSSGSPNFQQPLNLLGPATDMLSREQMVRVLRLHILTMAEKKENRQASVLLFKVSSLKWG